MARDGDGEGVQRRVRDGRDYDDRFRGILDGAAEVFYERGFQQGTLAEIAQRVGLSQPALYHYVDSKDELLRRIMDQVARDLTDALDAALAVEGTATEQLRAIVRQVTAAIVVNRKTFAVYWQELKALPGEVSEAIRSDERDFVAAIREVVEGAQREGHAAPGRSPAIVTAALLGMMCWQYTWYEPDRGTRAEDVAATFEQLVGLAPTPD